MEDVAVIEGQFALEIEWGLDLQAGLTRRVSGQTLFDGFGQDLVQVAQIPTRGVRPESARSLPGRGDRARPGQRESASGTRPYAGLDRGCCRR